MSKRHLGGLTKLMIITSLTKVFLLFCQTAILVVWQNSCFSKVLRKLSVLSQTTTLVVRQTSWQSKALHKFSVGLSNRYFGGLTKLVNFISLTEVFCCLVKPPFWWFDKIQDHCKSFAGFSVVLPPPLRWFDKIHDLRKSYTSFLFFVKPTMWMVWKNARFSQVLRKLSVVFVKPPFWWFDKTNDCHKSYASFLLSPDFHKSYISSLLFCQTTIWEVWQESWFSKVLHKLWV